MKKYISPTAYLVDMLTADIVTFSVTVSEDDLNLDNDLASSGAGSLGWDDFK